MQNCYANDANEQLLEIELKASSIFTQRRRLGWLGKAGWATSWIITPEGKISGIGSQTHSISIDTGKSQWEKPKYKQCKLLQELPDNIVNLANITISDANLTVPNMALTVLRVDHTFEGMAFSIHSYKEGTDPESKNVIKALTTYIVSASISDTSIQNLADPVVITLQHIEGNQNYDQVQCAFWDFGNNRFLIFVFHCMMKESMREQWQIHFYCRWLRMDNFSVGSSRCRLNVGYKQERLKKTFKHKLLMPSLKSTATSSTFKSLGSVQGMPSEISSPNGERNKYVVYTYIPEILH
ncbi:Putative G-protein coupled receptor 112 [Pteropus alecto]|uniref:Putative G-protein coupled receptor 112 n=1 Tax=Pteropus alecto TaxID=9402 RepID=L5JUR3_PTEAL|nr:Putative G-protein coupled receptor 112 [Pteropus alecto]